MNVLALILVIGLFPQESQPNTERSWHFGHYRVQASNDVIGSNGYRIYKDAEQVFAADPAGFDIISVSKGKQLRPNEPTVTDITGDGIPDLIIEEYPRNPGCCFGYSIFSLGTKFRQISHLSGLATSLTFQDVNRDGIYEIVGEDWSFLSHYASPQIVFGYRNGEYQMATTLMRKAPPTPLVLAARSRKLAAIVPPPGSAVPYELYEYMLELVYGGNAQSAWQALERVWPKGKPGKAEFRQDFLSELEKSPFWPQIRRMNGNALSTTLR
jgi:hypothetical protein